VAGHGRFAAAQLLDITHVPTIRLEGLSDQQIRAYIIADNKLAENAGWDRPILAIELQHLLKLDCVDFDVTVIENLRRRMTKIHSVPNQPNEEKSE
jgi:ParB-like chromosome segregation protein Spo0J